MSDNKQLQFTLVGVISNQLEIKVENTSGAALDDPLMIEIRPAMYLTDKRVADASKRAPRKTTPPRNMESLAGIVTAADGWSVWAIGESTASFAIIQIFNDLDQVKGKPLPDPVKFEAGAEFTIRIPLDPKSGIARAAIDYSYLYGDDETNRVNGALEVVLADAARWEPDVTLTVLGEPNPTSIKPGTLVKIKWHVANGVSAKLYGPLPGGNTGYSLDSDPESTLKIEDGTLEIRVVGPMTYMLQAQVREAENKESVQVVRMLSLDTLKHKTYAEVRARQTRVLPNGLIEIDWSAWGVEDVTIHTNQLSRKIELTEQNMHRYYQGLGVMRLMAGETQPEKVRIEIIVNDKPRTEDSVEVDVVPWVHLAKPKFTGSPIGLAVATLEATAKMALLTSDGLYIAAIDKVDKQEVKSPDFKKAGLDAPEKWLALAALGSRFVVLQQTKGDGLRVVPYTSEGKPDPEWLPVDLPANVKSVVTRGGTVFDLVAFGNRVYVVAEAFAPGGAIRRAFSVRFETKVELRAEPLLESLAYYRLVIFDGALYAVNRSSGRMFRFSLNADGKLEPPRKAKSAVEDDQSMIRQGLLTPVGRVFAVLNPSSVPSLESLAEEGLRNTMSYETLQEPENEDETPQDLVYNPQTNLWTRCGHGLRVKKGAVIAFRGGDSPRLWLLQPDGELYTLQGVFEYLFACGFVKRFSAEPLPVYLNKKRKFKVKNNTGINLIPVNDIYRAAGFESFSSTDTARLDRERMPPRFRSGSEEIFEFTYNEEDPAPISLRFLTERGPRDSIEHMIELTFSGRDLSVITSAFKRPAIEQQNVVFIANMPGTVVEHPADRTIEVPRPRVFDETYSLHIVNATPHRMEVKGLQLPAVNYVIDSAEIKLDYKTPDFSLVSPQLGELRFNIDFAKLPGIASSSETVTRDCMVRINTDKSTAAVVQMVRTLKPGDPSLEVETLERKKTFSATNNPVYVCQIGYQLKQELNAVLIGDAASGFKRMSDHIYIPTANPQNVSQVQLCSVDLHSLATKPSATLTGKGIFSLPNSIDISDDKVFAMFGDTAARLFDHSLQPKGEPRQFKCSVVTGMKTSGDDEIYVLAANIDQTNLQSIKYKYSLMRGHAHPAAGEPVELLTLDSVRGVREQNRVAGAPAWVTSLTNPPMAIDPMRNAQIGRKVAICIEGGLIVIESRSEKIDVIALEGTGREEAILFDNRGDWIYCAHSEPDGKELKISRVNTRNLREKHKTILLPTKETISSFITDIRSAEARQGLNRSQRAASLGISLYDTPLFVSHGRTILQLDTQSMTVRRSATVELPCRLMYVTQDRSFCWMVYAMGATGSSDGSSVKEYKTHLYKLAFARDV